jgi:type II restriction enzyme
MILRSLGLPSPQQNEMAALTLLALCGLHPSDAWDRARRYRVGISKDIMVFIKEAYRKEYAPNTRETFRRQVLHQFVQARIADYNPYQPDLPTNSPNAHYAITEAALAVARIFGQDGWEMAVARFLREQGNLAATYRKERAGRSVSIHLPDGATLEVSPGRHNTLQAAVIQHFRSHFAPNSDVLYLGDTEKKNLVLDVERFVALHIPITEHDKLPDIVLYDSERNWLFLIEVVTSHGPVTPKRVVELESMLSDCDAERIYVTAFPDFREFRRHLKDIAWETEVWVAEIPDHLIHFNGDRFFGPR